MRRALQRLSTSQRAEAGAMVAVAAMALATLVQSAANAEPMASEPAADAAYGPSGSLLHASLLKRVASEIREGKVVVLDDVLDMRQLALARKDAGRLHDGGRFGRNANEDEANRRDEVLWVTGQEEGLGAGLSHAVALLRGLGHELGRAKPFEEAKLFVQTGAQLACYAGDSSAHYAAHRDASDESVWSLGLNAWLRARPYRERAVTAVLYLNEPSWDTERQGGSLRCYVKGEEEAVGAGGATGPAATRIISLSATNKSQQDQQRWQHMDIAPQGGRLVLFDSKAVLHEVLPSHQGVGRMALTVWISDRAARWW